MDNNWIKISERKPTVADLPVWYFGRPGHQTGFYRQLSNHEGWTHWKHAVDAVPEPPKEPTQAEKDDSACEKAWLDGSRPMATNGVGWFKIGWNLALRYERAEILAMIRWCRAGAIRARCEGGRK